MMGQETTWTPGNPAFGFVCAARGHHIIMGTGSDTTDTATIWSDRCATCGVRIDDAVPNTSPFIT